MTHPCALHALIADFRKNSRFPGYLDRQVTVHFHPAGKPPAPSDLIFRQFFAPPAGNRSRGDQYPALAAGSVSAAGSADMKTGLECELKQIITRPRMHANIGR